MLQRRVLYLADSRLIAYRAQRTGSLREAEFAADAAGLAAFEDYLGRQARSRFRLLVDCADEVFRSEDIPHCTGRDRQAILRRKLAQQCGDAPYAVAVAQGRLKTGRRDERLLCMALAQPQLLDPWIAALRKRSAALAGIYSVAQLLGRLLPDKAEGPALLLTQTSAGLRQTFFQDGRLRFSRLGAMGDPGAETYACAAAVETVKMHQYLVSQRYVERETPLPVRVLVHPAASARVRETCFPTGGLRFETVDLLAAVRRLGGQTVCEDSRVDPLLAHLLAVDPPAEQFAPAALLDHDRLRRWRFALRAVGVLALTAAAVGLGVRGLTLASLADDSALLKEQARLQNAQYDARLQALPPAPLPPEALRALLARHDALVLRAPGPTPLLIQLAQALEAHPQVELERIEWRMVEQLPADAAAHASLPESLRQGPYAVATVETRLPAALAKNPRDQAALVESLLAALGKPDDSWAQALRTPQAALSSQAIRSGAAAEPILSLRIVRKLRP